MKIRRVRRVSSCRITGKALKTWRVCRNIGLLFISLLDRYPHKTLRYTEAMPPLSPDKKFTFEQGCPVTQHPVLWFDSQSDLRAHELDAFQVKSNQRCNNCLWMLNPENQTTIVSCNLPAQTGWVLGPLHPLFCFSDPLKMNCTTSQHIHRQTGFS